MRVYIYDGIMFYFRKRTCLSFTIRPIATGRKTWKRTRYQQAHPNKQFLETAGSNYERAFSDFVQALVKLDRLRRLYFFTTAIVQR